MGNNLILTVLLTLGVLGTLYFLFIGAKAVFRLLGLIFQVLTIALLAGVGYAYVSRTVDKYEPASQSKDTVIEDPVESKPKDELLIDPAERNYLLVNTDKIRKI